MRHVEHAELGLGAFEGAHDLAIMQSYYQRNVGARHSSRRLFEAFQFAMGGCPGEQSIDTPSLIRDGVAQMVAPRLILRGLPCVVFGERIWRVNRTIRQGEISKAMTTRKTIVTIVSRSWSGVRANSEASR